MPPIDRNTRARVELVRNVITPDYTQGMLMLDGRTRHAWTLEDPVREVRQANGTWLWRPEAKVPKKTAIPSGVYRLVLSESQRFGRVLPEILEVPDFTAIRVHGCNTVDDTEGCPLIGAYRSRGHVGNSAAVVDAFVAWLSAAIERGPQYIRVRNDVW